jgi:transcriptional regulator with XRE-family HTH domain
MAKLERPYVDVVLKERNITTQQVAAVCGTTSQAVLHWRTGHRQMRPPYAKKLAAAFDIPLHLLRPDLWDPPPAPPPAPPPPAGPTRPSFELTAPEPKSRRRRQPSPSDKPTLSAAA